MKAPSSKNDASTLYPTGKSTLVKDDRNFEENQLSFQEFTVPSPMTQEEIAPPLHVWEKIVSVLDEQDRHKELLKNSSFFFPVSTKKSKYSLLFVAVAIAAVAVITLLLF